MTLWFCLQCQVSEIPCTDGSYGGTGMITAILLLLWDRWWWALFHFWYLIFDLSVLPLLTLSRKYLWVFLPFFFSVLNRVNICSSVHYLLYSALSGLKLLLFFSCFLIQNLIIDLLTSFLSQYIHLQLQISTELLPSWCFLIFHLLKNTFSWGSFLSSCIILFKGVLGHLPQIQEMASDLSVVTVSSFAAWEHSSCEFCDVSGVMSLRPRSVLVSRPYHLRRICPLFLLDGEFPKCQLDQLDGWCYSVQQYPYWFSACLINQLLREDVEEANHRSGFIYFSLQFNMDPLLLPPFQEFPC